MKIQTAHYVATHLDNCLTVLKNDKSTDINLIGKFEELAAKAHAIIANLEKEEAAKKEKQNGTQTQNKA